VNKFRHRPARDRVEDPRFITGRGRFVDDIDVPHQCYGVVVMSPHAHARIKRVDTAKAKRPTACLPCSPAPMSLRTSLARSRRQCPRTWAGRRDFARCARSSKPTRCARSADRVAFVVAETLVQAKNAAELIEIDYEPLPAVVTVEDATKPGAPAIWSEAPNNIAFTLMMGNRTRPMPPSPAPSTSFRSRLNNSRITANSIEPRAAIGPIPSRRRHYTLHSTSQNPHGTRSAVAGQVLKIPETKLRVISPDVGGGFGMKHGGYPRTRWWRGRRAASAARPVKWVSTRSERSLA